MVSKSSSRSPTNTLILTNVSEEVLKDPSLLVNFLSHKKHLIELVALERLQRIIIICETSITATEIAEYIAQSPQWHNIRISYSLKGNQYTRLNREVWDKDLQQEKDYLELPAEIASKRFLISPPLSPPAEWDLWDKVEEGPNQQTIHSPEDISHLLWERFGGFESSDVKKVYPGSSDQEESKADSPAKYEPAVLFKDIDNGVPAIVLDSAQNESPEIAKNQPSRTLGKTSMPPADSEQS